MNYRDLIRKLESDGWAKVRQGRGSHAVYRHPTKTGVVVVAGRGNHEVPKGTLNAIFRQAGLKEEPRQ